MNSSIELMGLRADVDFTYDDRGRMSQTNEPVPKHRRPAPFVLLGQVAEHHRVLRLGAQVPDSAAKRLEVAARKATDAVAAIGEEVMRFAPNAIVDGGPV